MEQVEFEMVDEKFACPNCGEQKMDWLIWDEDADTVKCQSCGTVYDPATEGR